MTRTKYFSLILAVGLMACNNEPKTGEPKSEEPTEVAPSSEDLMNAYVDSINVIADSLSAEYGRIMDDAVRNLDSAKENIIAYQEKTSPLKEELERLSGEVNKLMEENLISDEDYQSMFHEIRLSAVETTDQTLETIGIKLQAAADSLKN